MEVPELVQRAEKLAREVGFALTREEALDEISACLPGVGNFLAVLAAKCTDGLIGELGTGTGVGTAWMASAMPASCRLVTGEVDERRATAAIRLFADDARVMVLTGDAIKQVTKYGPFDLLFADCGVRAHAISDGVVFGQLVDSLRDGGSIVMDDITPLAAVGGRPATLGPVKREFFTHDGLLSTEVVLPDLRNSLLVGTKIASAPRAVRRTEVSQ